MTESITGGVWPLAEESGPETLLRAGLLGVPTPDCTPAVSEGPQTLYGPGTSPGDIDPTVNGSDASLVGTGPWAYEYNPTGANFGPGATGIFTAATYQVLPLLGVPIDIGGTVDFPGNGITGPCSGLTCQVWGYGFSIALGAGPFSGSWVQEEPGIALIYRQEFDVITHDPVFPVPVLIQSNSGATANDGVDHVGAPCSVNFRMQLDVDHLLAKVWAVGDGEPDWQIDQGTFLDLTGEGGFWVYAEGTTMGADGSERVLANFTLTGVCDPDVEPPPDPGGDLVTRISGSVTQSLN